MDEVVQQEDPETGLTVTRLTAHTSNHCYFTNPGWFDDGRQLLFASDRSGRTELATMDWRSAEQRALGIPANSIQTAVDPVHDRAVTWVRMDGRERLDLVDLRTGAVRTLLELEPGWQGIIPNFTADGATVCCGATEDLGDIGFDEHFAARPHSRILAVDVASAAVRVLHERDCWMGHVNTAPGRSDLISFCHEGPWTKVEHRVWCLDLNTGAVWKVHADMEAPACIGHEYWLQDGRRIAYHGYDLTPEPVLGIVDVHSGAVQEYRQPVKTKHSHSLDGITIVGDGSEAVPWILAWRMDPDGLRGPWKVCRHGGGWSEQRRHIHPRLAPDGRSVLFTSDVRGEPNLYRVSLPEDLETLPLLDQP
jgi:oligogalacturonide lyase